MTENFIQNIEDIQSIDVLPTILEVILQTTDLGFAAVARVTPERWVTCGVLDNLNFGLKPGDELEIETTFCRDVRQTNKLVVIDNVKESPHYSNHPIPIQYGFQSYISVPIILRDGTFFGTLCALDPNPNKLNNSKVIGMFSSYTELISFHLEALQKIKSKDLEIKKKNFQLEAFDFVSSHDLQEPLRKIQMFSSVLLGSTKSVTNKSSYLKKIHTEAQRMRNILKDLLVFSDYKKSSQKFSIIDLNFLLKNVCERLKKEFIECSGKISINGLPSIPVIPHQIEQLFYNLIINSIAFKSTTCNLAITIDSTIAYGHQLDYNELSNNQSYCELKFSDNGIGFEPSCNEEIFGMFRQLSPNKNLSSTGIGLTIARRIANNHNGFIIAEGKLNKGATFKIYLPMEQGTKN